MNTDQINALLEATGNEVEPFYPIIFSNFCTPKKLAQIIALPAAGGGGGGGGAAGGAAAAEEEKEEEKVEEEEAPAGGGDLFGGAGGGDGGGAYLLGEYRFLFVFEACLYSQSYFVLIPRRLLGIAISTLRY